MGSAADMVQFDVLLRGSRLRTGGSSPGTELRPRAEDLETCRAWLAQRGVDSVATSFGIACSSTREIFLALFGSLDVPLPPAEIRTMVAQVTFTPPAPDAAGR